MTIYPNITAMEARRKEILTEIDRLRAEWYNLKVEIDAQKGRVLKGEYGFTIGDELKATREFMAIIDERRAKYHVATFRGWRLDDIFTLNAVNSNGASVEKRGDGITGNIPMTVIVGMREAWLAQYETVETVTGTGSDGD